MNLSKKMRRISSHLHTLVWIVDVSVHKSNSKSNSKLMVSFDPSVESLNLGDEIIYHYCSRVLKNISSNYTAIRVPTHKMPESDQLRQVCCSELKFVCGTNLITPHIEEFTNWQMPKNLTGYQDIVTLGVGWGYYCNDISKISKFVYRTILSHNKLHSVRDSYTEKKFHEMGIHNVINTGCPTLWGLTPEHCASIPTKKANCVITTLTDYAPAPELDRRMIEILQENYDDVYVWIQGSEDESYLRSLGEFNNLKIIERNLDVYTKTLNTEDIDYVGTRLHAGIHAMNHGVRTIILAVDNRAIEMGKDFRLPVIRRDELENNLVEKIQSVWETSVSLPMGAINKWINQFIG